MIQLRFMNRLGGDAFTPKQWEQGQKIENRTYRRCASKNGGDVDRQNNSLRGEMEKMVRKTTTPIRSERNTKKNTEDTSSSPRKQTVLTKSTKNY